jgi:hypothetical protein
MTRILNLVELFFLLILSISAFSLIRLLLNSTDIAKITLEDLVMDFEFKPKERFLVYGFSDFESQISTLEAKYCILAINPDAFILIELNTEEDVMGKIPNDLSVKKYYNTHRVI